MKDWKNEPDSSIVCFCNNIDKKTIINSIKLGNNTLDKIRRDTKACTNGNCKIYNPSGKCCSIDILELIKLITL